jgi:hypothetical protein
MLDHLGQDADLRVVVLIFRAGCLDLDDQVFCPFVLDLGLVMEIGFLRCLEERRVEDLLLDRRMRLQRLADFPRQFEFPVVGPRLLELARTIPPLRGDPLSAERSRHPSHRCAHQPSPA